MAIAETARLIASLELKDKGFASGVAKAEGQVNKLDKSTSKVGLAGNRVSKSLSGIGKSAGGLGKAFGNAGKAATGLVGSLGPLLGVGGALGVGALFASSISKAEEFGATIQKVAAITGESVEATSSYVDALDKFGIGSEKVVKLTGILEKNLGKIGATTKTAAKFQADYGINVLDASGKVADATTVFFRATEFFNSNASASDKATALNKLYGKSWQDLIPIMSKGVGTVKREFGDALQLSKAELADLNKFREAQREFADEFGDLQVKVGVAILPALIGPMKQFTSFLSQHRGDIVSFFKGAVKGAQEVGSAITTFVLPAGKAILDAFNAIPPDIRKLLIGGVIANKALKVTLGIDPLKIVGGGITEAIKGALGGILQRGSPANPMFTKEVGVPGTGVGPGGGAGSLLKFAAALGLAAVATELFTNHLIPLANKIGEQEHNLDLQAKTFGATASQKSIADALAFAIEQRDKLRADPITEALDLFGERSTLDRTIKDLTASLDDFGKRAEFTGGFKGLEGRGIGFRPTENIGKVFDRATGRMVAQLDQLHKDFLAQRAILKAGTDAQKVAAAKALAADVGKGVGNVSTTKDLAAQLRATALTVKDPAARAAILASAARVEKKIQSREWIATQKAAAAKIVASNRTTAQKVAELKAIQQSLIAHGDSSAARIVGALLNGVVPAINSLKNGINVNLPGILPQPPGPRRRQNTPDVPVPPRRAPREQPGRGGIPEVLVKVTASHRDSTNAKVIRNRFGPTPAEVGAT